MKPSCAGVHRRKLLRARSPVFKPHRRLDVCFYATRRNTRGLSTTWWKTLESVKDKLRQLVRQERTDIRERHFLVEVTAAILNAHENAR
eukprot:1795061-Prymnesium_polylepis.1